MDPLQASQSLELINEAGRATRRAMARAGAGYQFIIWGIVWLFGYLGTQVLKGPASGYLWLALDSFGVLASAYAVVRLSRRVRSPDAWKFGIFWMLLLAFGGLMMWTMWPLTDEQYLLFVTLLISMGYALFGLWASTPLLIVGVAIGILAVLGWQFLPAYLGYWLAFTGGGGLIGAGLYILRAWQ
jgi:hypothetical protein